MNKTQLIEAVAARTKLSKAQSMATLNTLIEIIQESLANGDNVQLIGFGSFIVSDRDARKGRNPSTGEAMTIPAKKIIKFKPGKALTEAVAK
jgi:DNA-binding protein HU-beta